MCTALEKQSTMVRMVVLQTLAISREASDKIHGNMQTRMTGIGSETRNTAGGLFEDLTQAHMVQAATKDLVSFWMEGHQNCCCRKWKAQASQGDRSMIGQLGLPNHLYHSEGHTHNASGRQNRIRFCGGWVWRKLTTKESGIIFCELG